MGIISNQNIFLHKNGKTREVNIMIMQKKDGFDFLVDGYFVTGFNFDGTMNIYSEISKSSFLKTNSGKVIVNKE